MRRGAGGRRRGSQFVEAGLILLPLLALMFLAIDAGWAVFVKATLQQAVREGTRFAVTGHTVDDITARVKSQSMGLLDGSQSSTLSINCWKAGTAKPSPADPTGCNAAGRLIEIAVTGYNIQPLLPLLHSSDPIVVNVNSADILEAVP